MNKNLIVGSNFGYKKELESYRGIERLCFPVIDKKEYKREIDEAISFLYDNAIEPGSTLLDDTDLAINIAKTFNKYSTDNRFEVLQLFTKEVDLNKLRLGWDITWNNNDSLIAELLLSSEQCKDDKDNLLTNIRRNYNKTLNEHLLFNSEKEANNFILNIQALKNHMCLEGWPLVDLYPVLIYSVWQASE